MKIGYARVSTHEQNLDLQKDALEAAGCTKIYTDEASGSKADRAGLQQALDQLRQGDTLTVWRLDRLGRSLKHLVEIISSLEKKQISFQSITENIDTSSPSGKLIFHLFASLAEFERSLIHERTLAGLKAARARGRIGGRKKLLTLGQVKQARALHADKTVPIKDICKTLKISKTTLYRYLAKQDNN